MTYFLFSLLRAVLLESVFNLSFCCGNRISYMLFVFPFGSQKQYLQSLDLFCTGFEGKFKVKIVSLLLFLRVINLKSENTNYVCVFSGSGKHSRFVCLDFCVVGCCFSDDVYFFLQFFSCTLFTWWGV